MSGGSELSRKHVDHEKPFSLTGLKGAPDRHSNDVSFRTLWDQGDLPELWAYTIARQLRRADHMTDATRVKITS